VLAGVQTVKKKPAMKKIILTILAAIFIVLPVYAGKH
jgi:hypothetical protein